MPNTIKDGTGTGNLAEVDNYNQLRTKATMVSHIKHHSDTDQSAYVCSFAHTQQTGSHNQEWMGYIEYTGDQELCISQIIVSSEETGSSNTDMTKFGFWINGTVSGGTSVTCQNLFVASSLTPNADNYHTNKGVSPVTKTGGTSISTIRMSGPGSYTVNFEGALLLSKGNTLTIASNTANVGVPTRANIYYFEHQI